MRAPNRNKYDSSLHGKRAVESAAHILSVEVVEDSFHPIDHVLLVMSNASTPEGNTNRSTGNVEMDDDFSLVPPPEINDVDCDYCERPAHPVFNEGDRNYCRNCWESLKP